MNRNMDTISKKVSRKFTNIWKSRKRVLNISWYKEEITNRTRKDFELHDKE